MAKKGAIDIKGAGAGIAPPKSVKKAVTGINTKPFLPYNEPAPRPKPYATPRIPAGERYSERLPRANIVEAARYKKYIPNKDFSDNYDLPSYDSTNLTLIARDPNWIHAYWDIAPSSVETLKNRIGGEQERAAYTLRMYDITFVNFNGNNANHWFDLDFDPGATKNWYVNLWGDNASYCGEIGMRLPNGIFFPFTRSNIVTTPRKQPVDRSEEIWMRVDDDSSGAPFVIAEIKSEKKQKQNGRHAGPSTRRKIYLSEDDIRSYYSKISPLLRDILARRLAALGQKYDLVIKGGRGFLDELLHRGLTKGQFLKRILLGASEELVIIGGASESLGASEQMGASERIDVKRKFFFEIGTELIVYGRTEPDASVHLGVKNIPLRADGTFTLRFALPDGGKIPLDFTARSKDTLQKRRIETGAERKFTKYD